MLLKIRFYSNINKTRTIQYILIYKISAKELQDSHHRPKQTKDKLEFFNTCKRNMEKSNKNK